MVYCGFTIKFHLDNSMIFREGTVEHPSLFTKHVDSVYAYQIAWTESGATPALVSHGSTCETEHRTSSETGERGAPEGGGCGGSSSAEMTRGGRVAFTSCGEGHVT
jgi:hypothetical protein